ncbi:MAG TPA: sugar kinase [Gaiellaceae bacterium]|nr:sugar kinase [Gaiellaceae bacterium]
MARVVCAGILVADIFVPPLERIPGPGEVLTTGEFLVQPGGCAANTAIGLRRQGVDVSVIGCVGDDPFADLVERDLSGQGIDTTGIRRVPGLPTSMTVILPVAGEDRRYIHTFGANAAVRPDDLDADALEGADVLYVGGYLVLPGLQSEELAERLGAARERGATTVLDVALPGLAPVSLAEVAPLLPQLDWFVPNCDEASALTGEREPEHQAERLLEAGAAAVAITLGERGAYVAAGADRFALPAPPVDVVEPSGAGDAFDAGLISGLLDGLDPRGCAERATALGASACTALGAWAGVWTREQLAAASP